MRCIVSGKWRCRQLNANAAIGSWRRAVAVTLGATLAVAKAYCLRLANDASRLRLPETAHAVPLAKEEVAAAVQRVDRVVDWCACRTGHKCFYRAYARARVLRALGVPVAINLGLRGLGDTEEKSGHCWLTLEGAPFFEDQRVDGLYEASLGQSETGVYYWAGRNGAPERECAVELRSSQKVNDTENDERH